MKTSVTWVDIPTNFLFYNYCVDKDVNNDTEKSCCGIIINREVHLHLRGGFQLANQFTSVFRLYTGTTGMFKHKRGFQVFGEFLRQEVGNKASFFNGAFWVCELQIWCSFRL